MMSTLILIVMSLSSLDYVVANCTDDNAACSQCYETLIGYMVNDDRNMFSLMRTFSPPNDHPPEFIVVSYEFKNSTTTYTYFWTSKSSFFIQPLEIFQFLSFFLGTPSYLQGSLTIIFPNDCENVNPDHLEMLTYLLKAYAATRSKNPKLTDDYTDGRGANASEIWRLYYHGEKVRIGCLLLWYNLLFPLFGLFIIASAFVHYKELILSYLNKTHDSSNGVGENNPSGSDSTEVDRNCDANQVDINNPSHNDSTEVDRNRDANQVDISNPSRNDSTEVDRNRDANQVDISNPSRNNSTEVDRNRDANQVDISNNDYNDNDHDGDSVRKITVIILCTIFCLYIFLLDCCALFNRDRLPAAVSMYHNQNNKDSRYIYDLPAIAFIFDLFLLVSFFVILLRCLVRLHCGKEKGTLDFSTLYSLFTTLNIISVHLMYILIALINNPLHATGILFYYVMFIVLYVVSMKQIIAWCFQCKRRLINFDHIYDKFSYCPKFIKTLGFQLSVCIFVAIFVSIILIGLTGLIITTNVFIPIKDSIHDVPQQIESLFHFITTFLLGLITYKIFSGENS